MNSISSQPWNYTSTLNLYLQTSICISTEQQPFSSTYTYLSYQYEHKLLNMDNFKQPIMLYGTHIVPNPKLEILPIPALTRFQETIPITGSMLLVIDTPPFSSQSYH